MAHEGDAVIIQHYCEKLGVSLKDFAEQCRIAPDRLESYMAGEQLSAPETARLVEIVREQKKAEDDDVAEARWYRRPEPRTVWHALGDTVGLKQVKS